MGIKEKKTEKRETLKDILEIRFEQAAMNGPRTTMGQGFGDEGNDGREWTLPSQSFPGRFHCNWLDATDAKGSQ